MAWSTRQLADLAGTTVKAVRYYHGIGLLDQPERAGNGYKQYRVHHLVRLLQIKRLVDLGVPLARVPALGVDGVDVTDAIRELDAELRAEIERLEGVRSELGTILRHGAPVDVPARFADVAEGLSAADRALLLVYSRVLGEGALDDVKRMLQNRDPVDDEFDAIPADADEEAIHDLAARMTPRIHRLEIEHPWMRDPRAFVSRGGTSAVSTMGEAIVALYNPAQLAVMARIESILHGDEAPGA